MATDLEKAIELVSKAGSFLTGAQEMKPNIAKVVADGIALG